MRDRGAPYTAPSVQVSGNIASSTATRSQHASLRRNLTPAQSTRSTANAKSIFSKTEMK